MLSRRLIAFNSNVKQLVGRRGRLYFWTFTRAKRDPMKHSANMWTQLAKYLKRHIKGWAGVRVFEEHPGRMVIGIHGATFGVSHGLHVHFLSTRFYDVQAVIHIAKKFGWGKIHVVKVKNHQRGKVASYLAKYLSKRRPESLKGIRLVGYVGMGGTRTRYCDIRFFGHLQDCWQAASILPSWGTLKFHARCAFVHLLSCRCISEDTTPMLEMTDLVFGAPDRKRAEYQKRFARILPATGDALMELRQSGVLRHAEAVHGMRHTPKSLRLPVPPVSFFAEYN